MAERHKAEGLQQEVHIMKRNAAMMGRKATAPRDMGPDEESDEDDEDDDDDGDEGENDEEENDEEKSEGRDEEEGVNVEYSG